MYKKILVVACGFLLSCTSFAHTVFICGKKTGQPEIRMVHHHIIDVGHHIAGTFFIRTDVDTEISYGRRPHWERFGYVCMPDGDQLYEKYWEFHFDEICKLSLEKKCQPQTFAS